MRNSFVLFDESKEISRDDFTLGQSVTHKSWFPVGNSHLPMGKTVSVTAPNDS